MNRISRRQWLGSAAAMLSATRVANAAKFTHALGAQLYTVRNVLPNEAEQTLRRIADIGYTEVELNIADLARLAPMLKSDGLKPVSCHLDAETITGRSDGKTQPMTLAASIEEAKKHGLSYVVMPYIRPADRGDLDFFRGLTDKMNRAGEQCRAAGLQFCYHNHAFEFKGELHRRIVDIFLDKLDRKNVGLEMDAFWVSVAGTDPVEFLKRVKGRVPLLHLKDKKRDFPVQYEEKVAKDTFQEVGHGSLDFPAILRAAKDAGVQHYFVEQDQTPGDPVASLKQSYEYLRGLSL